MNKNTTDIIKRQLIIIQILLEGNYVSTRQIQEHLKSTGVDVKIRSIQRDLVTLEDILPIECRKDDKPYSWRWQRLESTQHNQLSLSQAIALRLVESELKGIIPADLYERLQPLFVKSHFVTGLSQLEEYKSTRQSEKTIVDSIKGSIGLQGSSVLKGFNPNIKRHNVYPRRNLKSLLNYLTVHVNSKRKQNRSQLDRVSSEDIARLALRLDDAEYLANDESQSQLIDELKENIEGKELRSILKLLDRDF